VIEAGAMHYPQLLVYEGDGRLALLLRGMVEKQGLKWSVRESRQLQGCLRLLQRSGPGVLVLKVGRDLERELTLLERVKFLHPDTGVVLVGEAEYGALSGLAWDLGADYVFLAPYDPPLLVAVVAGLMGSCPPALEQPCELNPDGER
jgi:hypothetical protein